MYQNRRINRCCQKRCSLKYYRSYPYILHPFQKGVLKKYLIFSETHLIDRLDPDRSGQFFDHSYFNRQGVADKPFNDFFRNNDGDLIFFRFQPAPRSSIGTNKGQMEELYGQFFSWLSPFHGPLRYQPLCKLELFLCGVKS